MHAIAFIFGKYAENYDISSHILLLEYSRRWQGKIFFAEARMKSRKPDKANFAVIRLYFSEIGTRKVTATCWHQHQLAGQSTFLSHFVLHRSLLPL